MCHYIVVLKKYLHQKRILEARKKYIPVQKHEILRQLVGDLDALLVQVGVHAEEDVVRVPVVARDLLLACYQHGGLGRLHVLLQAQVELEQVLGVLWHFVVVAHQVLDQNVRQACIFG